MSFSKKEIVIASSNNGKLAEFETFFQPFGIKLIPQRDLGIDDIEETGKTYIENAILKARNASKLSGLPAIADDSGLSVDFLNGPLPGYEDEKDFRKSYLKSIRKEFYFLPDSPVQIAVIQKIGLSC